MWSQFLRLLQMLLKEKIYKAFLHHPSPPQIEIWLFFAFFGRFCPKYMPNLVSEKIVNPYFKSPFIRRCTLINIVDLSQTEPICKNISSIGQMFIFTYIEFLVVLMFDGEQKLKKIH